MRKFLAIKRDEGKGRGKRRNWHEKQILHKLRGSTSLLLTRFYIPINKPAVLEEDIVMDYIPFPNLGEYLQANRAAISLATKVYLMFMVVQALRCLKDYGVVHLDLKPSNILIYCNLYIKLIDFGESYHPDICKPGTNAPIQASTPASPTPIPLPKPTDKLVFIPTKMISTR